MSEQSDRYLVVGNPIDHSRSPDIHRAFAAQFDDDMQYDKALVEPGDFDHFVDAFARAGGCGLNVTLPFKTDAFKYVDECDALASAAAAVNTIVLSNGEPSRGFNTDGVGLVADLTRRHGQDLQGKNILMLGAGGAAQGVIEPLLEAGAQQLVIANRTIAKAEALVAQRLALNSAAALSAVGFDGIQTAPDIVINATSSGLSGGAELIDPVWVAGAFCYDMSYGAAASFCAWAGQHGARQSVDGLGMLVEQAAQSYFLWRGRRPSTTPVLAMLRAALAG